MLYYNSTNTFYIAHERGRNVIEVNGIPVFNCTKLIAYDIISIGSTRLIFVPLCGDRFNWENPEDQR